MQSIGVSCFDDYWLVLGAIFYPPGINLEYKALKPMVVESVHILAISIALQFTAAFLALRLVRTTSGGVAWAFIAFALFLMGIRRTISFDKMLDTGVHTAVSNAELVALLISTVLVVGVFMISPLFTATQRAQQKLEDSEKEFQNLFENAAAGIARTRLDDGSLIIANERLAQMMGYDNVAAFISEYVYSEHYVNPGDRERVIAHAKANPGDSIEVSFTKKDGSTIVLSTSATVDTLSNQIDFVAIDITKQKLAEQALISSEARLSGILEIAPEAVIVIDDNHNIAHFNQAAERIFGYTSAEMTGHPLDLLLPPEVRGIHAQHIEEFSKAPEDFRLMDERKEVFGVRKDGSRFPATASLSKLEIDGSRVFVAMLHDITERKQIEAERQEALLEAQKADHSKSIFLASMSHELRTPLNAIIGFSDILVNEYLGPHRVEKYKEYSEDINASGTHLLALVNTILDISSIEAGKADIDKVAFPVREIAQECIGIVSNSAEGKNIELTINVPNDIPLLFADRRAVRQILLTLLTNAIKFTPEEGNITLSAKALKMSVSLSVIDTGRGIPKDDIAELTKPFNRVEQDPHKAVEGWGLGLAISKSLVELHDGTLTIESRVGKGTTVTVTLPNETLDS